MATDAQGRLLSDDGNYYWDGSNWQLVTSGDVSSSSQPPQSSARTDSQGRQLSEDGNYYWDGSNWQLASAAGSGASASGAGAGGAGDAAGPGQGVTAEDIMKGLHVLATAGEVAEIFGKCPEALAEWVEPIGGILTVIDMIINVVKALETEERGAGYRGTAYGTVYGALGKGTPSATCSGSLKGRDQDQLDQKAFDQAASDAASKTSDGVNKNRVLVRIAVDGDDPGKTVNKIYQQLCADSDDRDLARAYENLAWPGPVCA